MCAGKKECVTVNVNDKKEKLQKLLLLLNIRELYLEFKKLNPNVKIRFSKFCELGPSNLLMSTHIVSSPAKFRRVSYF